MELKTSAIAVVGIGCRFPGAPDPDAFWRLLRDGVDAISDVPAGRWDAARLHDPTRSRPGTANTRWGGFLDQVDQFDPGFFDVSRGEAAAMDPEQRLLLEVAWEALEQGGFAADRLAGSDTGVYLGIGPSDYASACFGDLARVNAYFASGTAPCMAANRLSHRLDLHGPSLGVDTGCSSSLVAIHLACDALRSGTIGMALAGAVNLMLSPRTTVGLSQAWMTAADGRCKPFDARADGYVRGEGCGVVVLKRLADAQRDGDTVLGILRGSAINQDGRGSGLTAPNPSALEAVLHRAMANAGISADAIDYVEAHGVGSAMTDAVEAQALGAIFGRDRRDAGHRPILGAVKSNIGHLEPAAGIAGLIKVLLALRHEEIPSNLHFSALNPRIDAADFPFTIPVHGTSWARGARPRLAGVNAFGLGGTNAHLIVEEGPEEEAPRSASAGVSPLFTLSAHTAPALRELAARHAHYLEAHPEIALAEAAYTVNVGRAPLAHRLAVRARSMGELVAQLDAFSQQHAADGVYASDASSGTSEDDAVDSLARRWMRGDAIDWSAVHPAARRRLSLPTYPFQRRRCWTDGVEAPATASVTPTAPSTPRLSDSLLGPLVRSPLGSLHVDARLSVDDPRCLDDHRILGEVVVSGPTQAALVMDIWTQAMAHHAPVLRDLVFAHPLLLAPGVARDVQIVLTPAGERVSEFQLFSRPAGAAHSVETWSAHGRGRICEGAPAIGTPIDLAAIERRCAMPMSAETFYARMHARDIQLGATFRWLDSIQIGDAEAIGRLRDAGPQDAAARAFHLHPGRLDTFFQLLFAALPHENTGRGAAMLLAVDEWRQHENDAMPRYVHARLRQGHDPEALVGDVTVFDRSGYALAEISGLHFLHVSREALRRTVVPSTRQTNLPAAAALQGTLAHDLAAVPAGARRAALQARVEAEVVHLLGAEVATPLDRACGLFDLGLDSLTCIALLNRLRTALGPAHSLPSTVVFDHPSIAALADHLLDTLEPAAAAAAPVRASSIAAAADEPMAIVGIGCRFPGGADGPEALWRLLRDGVDTIVDVPQSRWDADALYDPDPQARGKTSTRRGGFLGDVSGFDARFFGIAPREAESLDPQQRLLLEVAWEALEHAGIAPDGLKGTRSGVFVGTCFDDYARLRLNAGDLSAIDAYTGTGVERCFAAGRLAYVLGLQGPAMHVDTACSTSLVALHLACQSLRTGESDLALTGAANLILTPENTICFSRLSALAPDGRCKTFDAAADGYGRGEGCGVLVLKRLSTAVADGDRVLALVRGSAVNHDGASSGLTVPNGLAQQAVIRQALGNAGVSPHDVSYVEAHGTGTPLGDPIEIAALGAVLGEGRAKDDRFLVGSVKTNLGHLEPAAGVAGVIKVVLSMLHGEIPAHLHFHTPNPLLLLDEAHAAVPTALTPWRPSGRRIAGVSSFGMSGTNAHVVLEEAPATSESLRSIERPSYLLPLSARTESALESVKSGFAAHLLRHPEQPLADICATAFSGRSHFSHRLAIVASSREDLHRTLVAGEGVRGTTASGAPPRLAFLFTGQGAQWIGMGRQLFDVHPVFRQVLERCDARLRDRLPRPLLSLIFDADAASLLDQTACTQPATYALQAALAAVWRDAGVEPAMVLGHSVGELAAAHVAGFLDLEEGLDLAAERGRLMQSLTQPGAMVAVLAPESHVRDLLASFDTLSIAAVNGPRETVVSGDRDAVRTLTGQLASSGVRTRSMRVSHAFHSALMDPILDDLEQHAATVRFTPGRIPLISSRTGTLVDALSAHDIREHARQSVRFADGLRALDDAGCTIFVEIGPGTTLTTLGAQVLGESGRTFLPSLRKSRGDWQQLLETAGSLYTRGVPLNLRAIDASADHRPVTLPTYPFERTRYWLTPSSAARREAAHASSHALLGRRVDTPLASLIFESQFTASTPAFLGDHRLHGLALLPATAYFEMARHAATALGGRSPVIDAIALHRALVLDDTAPCTVQVIVTPKERGEAVFEIASRAQTEIGSDTARPWTVHAAGMLRLDADAEPPATPLDIPAVCQRLAAEPDMSAYYERLHTRGLEYGPAFRGVQALWRQPGEALGQVALADALRAGTETFHAHPALLDAALQVLIAAIPDGDEEKRAYAPIAAERVRCDEALPERFYSHGVLRSATDDPETLIGDVRIHDHHGRPLAIVEGLRVRRIASDGLQRLAAIGDEQLLHEVRWQHANDASVPSSIADGRWMVFTDDSVLAGAVIARLTVQHSRCDLVRPGDHYQAIGSSEWTLDPGRPEQFERLLRDTASSSPVRGIVWLWENGGTSLSPESLQHAESCGLRGLFHLSQALARGTARPRLALITRGASAIDDAPTATDPTQASMVSLLRALHLEHPDLPCVAIDLAVDQSTDDADAVVAALHRDDEPRLALRAGGAWVPRIVAARVPDRPPIALRADATYLITGGCGGLGTAVARWMAAHGAGHLVLVGRSAGTTTDDTLAALTHGTNARAMARAVDVSQRESLALLLDDIRDHLPPLAGIVHAAGVLDDGLILNQRWEQYERVLAPKVRGALHLHQLTRDQPLDFFVLFSSMASLLGSRGQASYVAANAFLDALAHARRAEGLCGLSINWGPWAEVGMADRIAHASAIRHGIGDLPPIRALDILGRLLASATGIAAQIGVIPIRWTEYLTSVPDRTASPFFDDMTRSIPARPATQEQRGALTRRLADIPLAHRRAELTAHVRHVVARALGLSTSETIDPAERLFALGLDSLMAVDVSQRLKIDVDRDLPATLLFDYPTVDTLASYLAAEVYGLPALPGRTAAHTSPDFPAADDLARTAAAIEDLGDDEMEALLLARLERTGGGR